jgi:hypothetical protein
MLIEDRRGERGEVDRIGKEERREGNEDSNACG